MLQSFQRLRRFYPKAPSVFQHHGIRIGGKGRAVGWTLTLRVQVPKTSVLGLWILVVVTQDFGEVYNYSVFEPARKGQSRIHSPSDGYTVQTF